MKVDSEKYAKDCWAWSLGDCGGGISREHDVSQSVFPDQSIFVQGMDWCLDKAKEIRKTLLVRIAAAVMRVNILSGPAARVDSLRQRFHSPSTAGDGSSSYPQLRRGRRFSHSPKELSHQAAENGERERYMHCQVVKVSAGSFDHFSHDDPYVRYD
jgi:hypothetical protein